MGAYSFLLQMYVNEQHSPSGDSQWNCIGLIRNEAHTGCKSYQQPPLAKMQSTQYAVRQLCACRQYIQPAPAAKKRSYLSVLLLLTDLAWIATYLASMGLNSWSFENLKLNPMAGGTAATLTTLGAVDYDKVVNGHQWWRIVAAPFVCSGQPTCTACAHVHVCACIAVLYRRPCTMSQSVKQL